MTTSRRVEDIAFSRSAVRALTRMPRNHAKRTRENIAACANDPASQANNARGLVGLAAHLPLPLVGPPAVVGQAPATATPCRDAFARWA